MNELQQRRRGLARVWKGAEMPCEPWESAGVTRDSWIQALRAAAINFLHVSERLARQSGAPEVAVWSEDAGAEYDQVRAGDPAAVQRWLRSDRQTDPEGTRSLRVPAAGRGRDDAGAESVRATP